MVLTFPDELEELFREIVALADGPGVELGVDPLELPADWTFGGSAPCGAVANLLSLIPPPIRFDESSELSVVTQSIE